MMTRNNAVGGLAAILLFASAGSVFGQQPPPRPAAPAQSEAPQQTTATYADWVVQCAQRKGEPGQICDMAQVTQVQGQNAAFSRVTVAEPEKGQPVKLVIQVPANVSFATNVRIQTSDDDPGLAAPFATCTPGGCFAVFDVKDDALRKLRAASGAGKFSFTDAAGRPVAVPLSFNGFGQAYDALAKK
jgi:invasion protein IalB